MIIEDSEKNGIKKYNDSKKVSSSLEIGSKKLNSIRNQNNSNYSIKDNNISRS